MNRSAAAVAALIAAGCSDVGTRPLSPEDAGTQGRSPALTIPAEIARPRIDVTGWSDVRILATAPAAAMPLLLPGEANGLGTGSALLIEIPGAGTFGCSANFIWSDGSTRYLGAAGHCFLPADRASTHGVGADYDASGVVVDVCITGCDLNFDGNQLVGTWVRLGRVAYARQTNAAGEDVGNDFGVVEIPASALGLIRPAMPVWGGPTGSETLELGALGCHYGHGLAVGEIFATKARSGLGGGSTADFWMGDFAAGPGDSGSGMVACDIGLTGLRGGGAVGILTHLGVSADPATFQHGFVLGTTMRRAIEMAAEAGLVLSLVGQ